MASRGAGVVGGTGVRNASAGTRPDVVTERSGSAEVDSAISYRPGTLTIPGPNARRTGSGRFLDNLEPERRARAFPRKER
jgi:hypothetical protein